MVTSQHQISFISQHQKTMVKSSHVRCLLRRRIMHRRSRLRTPEYWISNVSVEGIALGSLESITLPLSYRCSHSHTVIRIEFRSKKSRQRHGRLPWMPNSGKPSDKEDRMVSQQQTAALITRHHHNESVAGFTKYIEANTRTIYVSGGQHSRQRQ